MWDAYNESIPKELDKGGWHIPFGDRIDISEEERIEYSEGTDLGQLETFREMKLKVATARCARIAYNNFDGEIDYKKDIELHDSLLTNRHMSPFEHCARAMSQQEYDNFVKGNLSEFEHANGNYYVGQEMKGWSNNFRGFIPYRYLVENNII